MATGRGEPQGERRTDHCGSLYLAGHLWANHFAAGPAYLYYRYPAATIGHALVRHNEFWGGRVRPDGGRSTFLGFYGSGHWPGDHDRFGPGGPDFCLLPRMVALHPLSVTPHLPCVATPA